MPLAAEEDLGPFASLLQSPSDPQLDPTPAKPSEDLGPFAVFMQTVAPASQAVVAGGANPPPEEHDLGPFAQFVTPPSTAPDTAAAVKATPSALEIGWNAVKAGGAQIAGDIFRTTQGVQAFRAYLMEHPTPEMTDPQGDQLFKTFEEQQAETKTDEATRARVREEALASAQYWKGRAASAPAESFVDPTLDNHPVTQIARGLAKGGMMAAEAAIPIAGLPVMASQGMFEVYADALNHGQSEPEAEMNAAKSLIGLAIFGGANKAVAGGIGKALGSDAGALKTFVVQLFGQTAGNEATGRALMAYDAAAEAPEGKKMAAAVEALNAQSDLGSFAMNLGFGAMGAAHAAGKATPGQNDPTRTTPIETSTVSTGKPSEGLDRAQLSEQNTSAQPSAEPAGAASADAKYRGGEAAEAAKVEVPEHLRPDPEVARILVSEEAQTGPQMRGPQGAAEGGALFGKGGTRPTVTPKGVTPKGDTEFLRIEPGWKRVTKGLEREGAADVIGRTKNKVGQLLSKATQKHVDTEQEIYGQLTTELQRVIKSTNKGTTEKAFEEVMPYLAAKENGRPLPILTAPAQRLVTAWENIAEQTGKMAAANNVQVFDPTTGAHRPMHVMGKAYVPRMLKTEVQQVMRDPERNPKLWNNLVADLATQRGIPEVEAAAALRTEAGRFSANDFMGNLEMARVGKMPESFYEYDLRKIATSYIPSFSERMAQIIAYGQRLGPREAPTRANLWDVARKEAANDYTQQWLTNAEDQAVNLRMKGAAGTGMARAQTMASGLLLSSPTTTVMRNLISGVSATPELMGMRRSIESLVQTARSSQSRMDAREIGVVRDNIGDFLHADRLGDSLVDDAIRATVDAGLKYSGYNGSEVFVRSHGALTASQFARDGVAAIAKNPASMRSKEALALFKRMGADAEKIVAEKAEWKTGPETRKFIRTILRETQGGYRFDQVPLWANSNMGRFFYQFGRWGTQRARNIWRNGIQPALGEEVKWHGKTMTRRDVRPLLKMAGAAVVLGETFAGISQILFGRDRKDASMSEITAAWDEDHKKAVGLAMERVVNDVIMAGTLGIWSQPVDWAKGLKDQSRLKNPTDPPGLGSVKAMGEFAQATIDQGDVTRRDLLNLAGGLAPGGKQLSDLARNVFDEPLYEAENDVRTLRAAAHRWAKDEGMDVAPRARGSFRKSEMAPIYGPIKDALLVGDVMQANYLKDKFLSSEKDRGKALINLRASVKQGQPFRAGPFTADQHRKDFEKWARLNLNMDDWQQTKRIQERYTKAAQRAELW